MEGIWWVAFAAVLGVGVTTAHLGEILLKQISPHFGEWFRGKAGSASRGEMADIRRALAASRREIARIRTLEEEVGRLQAQVGFLERLLDGRGSRNPVTTLPREGSIE
ncbi:MAG: hypothetical protein EA422_13645 [Gemmatimonadales bacterium]|nr:MAG: hypothetical protein EA422_13645 [Gemmatimonadales bacterium]